MKNVAITTFISHNFGTCLQAFALKRAVEKLRFSPLVVTSRKIGSPPQKKRVSTAICLILGLLKKYGPIRFIKFLKARRYWALNDVQFLRFVQDYLPVQNNKDNLSSQNFSYAIAGSDMIWSAEYTENMDLYFLRWVEPYKRIAYAPSFGETNVELAIQNIHSRYIREFKNVSCREQSGCEYIKKIAGVDAKLVCDPTLLFTSAEWHGLLDFMTSNSPIILVNCFGGLDKTDTLYLKQLAKRKGLQVRYLNTGIDEALNEAKYGFEGYGPIQFLSLSSSCEFQIVNGYHGLLFALTFGKPFVVLHRYQGEHWAKHEQRMSDILDYLGLSDRYINSLKEISDLHFSLDYSCVNTKLEAFRKESWEYLSHSLKQ